MRGDRSNTVVVGVEAPAPIVAFPRQSAPCGWPLVVAGQQVHHVAAAQHADDTSASIDGSTYSTGIHTPEHTPRGDAAGLRRQRR